MASVEAPPAASGPAVEQAQVIPTAVVVNPPIEPAQGAKSVISHEAVKATNIPVIPAATPAPTAVDALGVFGMTKKERDARRRALIAGAPAAQAKLDAEEAAKAKVALEIQENERKMEQIGKDLALEMINRVALPRRDAPEKE